MQPGGVVAGRYQLISKVAVGSGAVTFRGHDLKTGLDVTVQVLNDEQGLDLQRFDREATLLEAIDHPSVARCVAHGDRFLVTQWLDGVTLEERLRDPGLTLRESVTVARNLMEALAILHEHGIVHRDVNPRTVRFHSGELKLAGFGVADRAGGSTARPGSLSAAYLAPEQLGLGHCSDGKSDVFSVGVIVYECIAGRHPFAGEELQLAILLRKPPALEVQSPEAPAALIRIVQGMLAKDPAERPSARALASQLSSLGSLDDTARRRSAGPGRSVAGADPECAITQATMGDDDEGSVHLPPGSDVRRSLPRTYLIEREIARGGMGRVLSARDERLDRTVAIKELLRHSSAARFIREARIAARLEHPNIVPVHDLGIGENGEPFYSMKLVSGRSLSDAIAGAASLEERLALLPHALAVVEAIAYAHSRGVIHRDIKPSNVVLGEFGETLVVDWGVAKELHSPDLAVAETDPAAVRRGGETRFGEVLGTPDYMAPEQAEGRCADERSDIYSLGVLLYKMVSGVMPQTPVDDGGPEAPSEDEGELTSRPVVPLRARRLPLPADLVAIVEKAMARDPEARYAAAGPLAEDLKRFTTGQLVGAHRYGSFDLVRRWVARNRAAFASASIALVIIIVGAMFSVQRILRANRATNALLRDSYLEQGRLGVLEGDRLAALQPLEKAYRMGATRAATRLMLEEAARPARARTLTLAHTDFLSRIAYSPDMKWIATASQDTARVWDAETGTPHAVLRSTGALLALAFSPDSRLLAAGSDEAVRIWDVNARREVTVLPTGAWTAEFSANSSILLTTSKENGVQLWGVPDGRLIAAPGTRAFVRGARFCRGDTRIITWDDHDVVGWDVAAFAKLGSYQEPRIIQSVAVSPSCSLIAMGTREGDLVVLRADLSVVARRDAHSSMVLGIDIAPDETTIASGSYDRTVRLWSSSGEPRGTLTGSRAGIMYVGFASSGTRLVTAAADGTARVWSTSGMLLGEMAGHANLIRAAALRSDGRRLATASWDNTVVVWDLERAEELRPIAAAARAATAQTAVFDPGGERIAITRTDGAVSIVDLRTGGLVCDASGPIATRQISWIGHDDLAVLREGARAIERWNVVRCAREAALDHPAPVITMSRAAGGRLVTATYDTVHVWNAAKLEATLTGYEGRVEPRPVASGATEPSVGIDGEDIYAITFDPSRIVLDDLHAPGRRRVLVGPTDIIDVRFDRARGLVVAPSFDHFLYVWDRATGALVRKLQANGPLWAARMSPDGSKLVGVGGTSPIIWDQASGSVLGALDLTDLALDGAFIDDEIFLSLGFGRTVIVWDLTTRRPLMRFPDVDTMTASDDRRSVAFISPAGIRVWSPRFPPLDLH